MKDLPTDHLEAASMPGCRVCAYDAGDGVRIELALQRDGTELWAARRHGLVVNWHFEWEWEPWNSSRTDDFRQRTRFASPREALDALVATREREVREDAERVRQAGPAGG